MLNVRIENQSHLNSGWCCFHGSVNVASKACREEHRKNKGQPLQNGRNDYDQQGGTEKRIHNFTYYIRRSTVDEHKRSDGGNWRLVIFNATIDIETKWYRWISTTVFRAVVLLRLNKWSVIKTVSIGGLMTSMSAWNTFQINTHCLRYGLISL